MKLSTKNSIKNHIPIEHGGKFSFSSSNSILIDFSTNVNPLGISPKLSKFFKRNLDKISDYPDVNSTKLLEELQNHLKIPKKNILIGNGAIEIIYNFCSTFLSKKKVLISIPTFGEYEIATNLSESKQEFFETLDLSKDYKNFIKKIPSNGCIFICNPNNPTGTIVPKKQMLEIIKYAKNKSSLVFVDECFIELVPNGDESIIKYTKKFDNLLVLRSFTKSFGLAGIRVGYAVSSKQIIDILKKLQIPWSVNAIAQDAALISLKDKTFLKKTNSLIKNEIKFLEKSINKLPYLSCQKTSTNFILIKTNINSTLLQKKLLEKKILVRDCKNFRGLDNRFIRIAVKTHKENLKLISTLENLR